MLLSLASIYCFVRKALIQQLPTMSNLLRWGKSTCNLCPLCQQVQTNKHVFSNCSSPVVLDRYKRRHNAVLHIFGNWLKSTLIAGAKLYADIPDFAPLSDLFSTLRPDIAVTHNSTVYVWELTICHESNFRKSKDYKLMKYKYIKENLHVQYLDFNVDLNTLEMSVLGFMSNSSNFVSKVALEQLPESVYANVIRNVIYNSYNIYLNRNNAS